MYLCILQAQGGMPSYVTYGCCPSHTRDDVLLHVTCGKGLDGVGEQILAVCSWSQHWHGTAKKTSFWQRHKIVLFFIFRLLIGHTLISRFQKLSFINGAYKTWIITAVITNFKAPLVLKSALVPLPGRCKKQSTRQVSCLKATKKEGGAWMSFLSQFFSPVILNFGVHTLQ